MPTLGEAVYYLRGDRSQLDATMSGAERDTVSAINRLGATVKGSVGNIFQFAVGGMLQQGIANAMGAIQSSWLGTNAMLETTTMQFTTLMGSSDRATQHVADLFEIAAKTPFETEPIINMSRMFQTFGGDILNTRDNIVLFGDAAAATQAPLDRVGFWIGRLYSAVQAGQPFGEAAMNLQELALMAPEVRTQMEAMQKSGADSAEVWAFFTESMHKFDGAMEKQAGTWAGLASTFSDSMTMIGARAFKPFFNIAKDVLGVVNQFLASDQITAWADGVAAGIQGAYDWVKDMASDALPYLKAGWEAIQPALKAAASGFQVVQAAIATVAGFVTSAMSKFAAPILEGVQRAIAGFEQFREAGATIQQALGYAVKIVIESLGNIASQAQAWGEQFIASYSQGFMSGIQYIVDALMYLQSVIVGWLQPGSPPALLPDLDKWGEEAAQVYGQSWMKGWKDSFVKNFGEMAGTVKSVLDNLVSSGVMPEMDLAPTLLNTREALGGLINEFRDTGNVSEETFERVKAAAGSAGDVIDPLIRSYVELMRATEEVGRAQEELNRITEEYAGIIDPLQAQLDELNDQEKAIKDRQRLAKIDEEMAKTKEGSDERALLEIERQKILKEQEIEAAEESRDVAVDAAEDKLDAAEKAQEAAQAQYDSQKAALDIQHEQNDLIQQQIKLLQQLIKEQEAAAKGAGGGGGGGGKGPKLPKKPEVKKPEEVIADVADAAGQAMSDTRERFSRELEEAEQEAAVFAQTQKDYYAQLLQDQANSLLATVGTFIAGIPAKAEELALAAAGLVGSFITGLVEGFMTPEGGAQDTVQEMILGFMTPTPEIIAERAGEFIGSFIQWAIVALQEMREGFITAFVGALLNPEGGETAEAQEQMISAMTPGPERIAAMAGEFIGSFVQGLLTGIPVAIEALGGLIEAVIGGFGPMEAAALEQTGTLLAGIIEAIGMYGPSILTALGNALLGIGQAIVDQAPTVLGGLGSLIGSVVSAIGAASPGIIGALGAWIMAFGQFAVDALPGLLSSLGTLVGSVLDSVGAALPGIVSSLATWIAAFIEWATQAAPGLLGELLKLATAMIDWIIARAPAIGTQLGQWAIQFIQWVGPAAGKLIVALGIMLAQLLAWVGQTASKLDTAFKEWGPKVWEWVQQASAQLVLALAAMASQMFLYVGNMALDLGTKAMEIGNSLVGGIRRGIEAKWAELKAWFTGLAASIIDAGKDAIGAHSPSLRAEYEIGQPIIQGIILGLKGMANGLYSTIRVMSEEIINRFADLSQEIGSIMDEMWTQGIGSNSDLQRMYAKNKADLASMFPTPEDVEEAIPDFSLADVDKAIGASDRYKELQKAAEAVNKELEKSASATKKIDEQLKALDERTEYTEGELEAIIPRGLITEEERNKRVAEFLEQRRKDTAAERADLEKQRSAALTATAEQQATLAAFSRAKAERDAQVRAEYTRLQAERQLAVAEYGKDQKDLVALRASMQGQLDNLEKQRKIYSQSDAVGANKWYQSRVDALMEIGKLQKAVIEANTDEERKAAQEQLRYIQEAQKGEAALADAELQKSAAARKAELADMRTQMDSLVADFTKELSPEGRAKLQREKTLELVELEKKRLQNLQEIQKIEDQLAGRATEGQEAKKLTDVEKRMLQLDLYSARAEQDQIESEMDAAEAAYQQSPAGDQFILTASGDLTKAASSIDSLSYQFKTLIEWMTSQKLMNLNYAPTYTGKSGYAPEVEQIFGMMTKILEGG